MTSAGSFPEDKIDCLMSGRFANTVLVLGQIA